MATLQQRLAVCQALADLFDAQRAGAGLHDEPFTIPYDLAQEFVDHPERLAVIGSRGDQGAPQAEKQYRMVLAEAVLVGALE
jgi:hypothetical protein